MDETTYTGLKPRESTNDDSTRLFAFYRVRSSVSTRFFPSAGASLHFASKDADTLTLPELPQGFLTSGDYVRAKYMGVSVFYGRVISRTQRDGRGSDKTEDVVCAGPWHDMARHIYRQYWSTGSGFELSSRLVLNQYQDGTDRSLSLVLNDIASHGTTACGYTVGAITANTIKLPYDECRDITIADALRRELRLFPKTICSFDYSDDTPRLKIIRETDPSDAAFLSYVKKSNVQKFYRDDVITGVDLEIVTTGSNNGVGYRTINHQRAGNTSTINPNCLYATLQIAGASSNNVYQTFDSKTEDIGDISSVSWWKSKHPRLANVAESSITISGASRTGSLPRISTATAGALEAAGLQAEVAKFTCTATISTSDDVEEKIQLTMHFLTTNATTKKYTYCVSSSSTSGESVPSGLAAAILAERSQALRAETMTIRLSNYSSAHFPKLGDACGGLLLQSFDVDCENLTASLNFGAAEWLSPEDMAGLLTNFRNKRQSTSCWTRSTPSSTGGSAEVELGGIPPLSSTEFAPGQKAKTTVAGESSKGKIVLDSDSLEESDPTLEVHKLTIKATSSSSSDSTSNDSSESEDKVIKILGTEDIEITPGSGGGGGTIKGNTSDSEEISLEGAVLTSASDSNVQIKTYMNGTTPTIQIGVYYLASS